MKKNILISILCALIIAAAGLGTAAAQSADGAHHILIAYFSWSGNTRHIAETLHGLLPNSDLFEIAPKTPYTSDYGEVLKVAQNEQNAEARPEIAEKVEKMDSYDTVFIGYPLWWYTTPMIIKSFLEQYDLKGKTIIPFCSHGGAKFAHSLEVFEHYYPDESRINDALAIAGSGGSGLDKTLTDWLAKLKIQ